nr:acylneuraminate cytidylyltransferase family protein [Cytophagales bacterium]
MTFTLGIITARGGSKGIKGKNIVPLCGKPIIHYTIESALCADCLDDIILSTDDQAIIHCALDAGLKCHGLRPDHLATDEAKSNDVIAYEVDQYEERTGQSVDRILLLQPTTPLRTSLDIENACSIFGEEKQSSLISCYNADFVHPRIMYEDTGEHLEPFLDVGHKIVRRQDMRPVYIRNGAIYLTDRRYFEETKRLVCDTPLLYEMPRSRSVNIDTQEDLELAAFYLQRIKE